MKKVQIDIWSDVVCPWCYIGKRNLETALASLPDASNINLVWHSFQLDPEAPTDSQQLVVEMLAEKYGVSLAQAAEMQHNVAAAAAKVGLAYHIEGTRVTNTRNAHRLIHWADSFGKATEMKERLLKANFVDNQHIGDLATLCALAGEVGLDAQAAKVVLESDQFNDQVDQDLAEAARRGIHGVPFFLFNGQTGFSGARPPLAFVQYLQQSLA